MKTQANAIKALTVLTVGTLLAACGSGTSKSSSDSAVGTGNSNPQQEAPTVTLSPINITSENYTQVSTQALKSLLLNDAGASALNRSVKVTGTATQQMAGVATGIVIELLPYPCLHGGQVAFRAEVSDTNGDLQINFKNPLHIDFSTNFQMCNQANGLLDGNIVLTMDGNLSEWINGGSYSFNSTVKTENLLIEQPGMPAFTLEGDFGYDVSSVDGTTVVTQISSSNSLYTADMSYQMIDYYVEKTVNNATQEYSYQISSEFNDFYSANKKVTYTTIEPLTGVGFALPTAGSISINGEDSSVLVNVLESGNLRLDLDLDNDGTVNEMHHTNWNDLVLSAFNNVQF